MKMDQQEERILVVGLPETGKSSFIQALDEVLKHPVAATDLRSHALADDRGYIQKSKPEFLAGKKLTRTVQPFEDTSVELLFEHPSTGRRGRLHLPDRKGEVFRTQWETRQWDKAYREYLTGISGALVFVRADEKARNDERLGVLAQAFQEDQSEIPRPWDMKDASRQVQLVDVLQFIMDQGATPRPLRVAVLISAWDTVGQQGDMRPREPTRFLDRDWALLAQYLRANPHLFTHTVYGVSAYGGPPDNLGDLLRRRAHERVQLADDTGVNRDLTRPLRWLLNVG